VRLFGLKGVALAALGDNPEVLAGAPLPATASKEGVKLGESTLNRFFTLSITINIGHPQQ